MICKYLWLASKTLKLGKLKSFKDFALVHSTNTYTPCFLLLFFIYYFFLYLSAIKGSPILTRKLFSKKNQAQRQPTFKPTHFSSRQGHEKTQSNHQIFTTSIHMLEIFIHLHSTILLLFTKKPSWSDQSRYDKFLHVWNHGSFIFHPSTTPEFKIIFQPINLFPQFPNTREPYPYHDTRAITRPTFTSKQTFFMEEAYIVEKKYEAKEC
jgi:hypothetical protein